MRLRFVKGHKQEKKPGKGEKPTSPTPSLLWGIECLTPDNVDVGLNFIRCCVAWLRGTQAHTLEGLFRKAGNEARMAELQRQTRSNPSVQFPATEDPHNVTTLLKRYFRGMKQPLLTFNLYDYAATSPEIGLEGDLRVAKFENENKMGATNLAIVFAPNILRPLKEDPIVLITPPPRPLGLNPMTASGNYSIVPPTSTSATPPEDVELHLSSLRERYKMHRTTTISEFEELRSTIPEEEFELQKIIVSSKIKSGNMLSMDDVQDLLKKEESGEAHHTMDENECPVMHRVPSVREALGGSRKGKFAFAMFATISEAEVIAVKENPEEILQNSWEIDEESENEDVETNEEESRETVDDDHNLPHDEIQHGEEQENENESENRIDDKGGVDMGQMSVGDETPDDSNVVANADDGVVDANNEKYDDEKLETGKQEEEEMEEIQHKVEEHSEESRGEPAKDFGACDAHEEGLDLPPQQELVQDHISEQSPETTVCENLEKSAEEVRVGVAETPEIDSTPSLLGDQTQQQASESLQESQQAEQDEEQGLEPQQGTQPESQLQQESPVEASGERQEPPQAEGDLKELQEEQQQPQQQQQPQRHQQYHHQRQHWHQQQHSSSSSSSVSQVTGIGLDPQRREKFAISFGSRSINSKVIQRQQPDQQQQDPLRLVRASDGGSGKPPGAQEYHGVDKTTEDVSRILSRRRKSEGANFGATDQRPRHVPTSVLPIAVSDGRRSSDKNLNLDKEERRVRIAEANNVVILENENDSSSEEFTFIPRDLPSQHGISQPKAVTPEKKRAPRPSSPVPVPGTMPVQPLPSSTSALAQPPPQVPTTPLTPLPSFTPSDSNPASPTSPRRPPPLDPSGRSGMLSSGEYYFPTNQPQHAHLHFSSGSGTTTPPARPPPRYFRDSGSASEHEQEHTQLAQHQQEQQPEQHQPVEGEVTKAKSIARTLPTSIRTSTATTGNVVAGKRKDKR